MRQMACSKQFVNETGDDLIPGKIHSIRKNYAFWKRLEGKDIALFTWEGRPYGKGSKKRVFCVKRVVSVQCVMKDGSRDFYLWSDYGEGYYLSRDELAKNDGFKDTGDFEDWFWDYPDFMNMAVVHFTDFRY